MSEEENNWGNQEAEISDTLMSEESVSKFSIALGIYIFDLDLTKSIKVEMKDKSTLINPTLSIESTFLTISNTKYHFFWISTALAFTGILVMSPLPFQIDWINSKLKEAVSDIDSLLLDCYFYNSSFIGVLVSGYFIPYKVVCI